MIEATAGLLLGGVLGRCLLWPLQLRLAARHTRRLRADIAALRHDLTEEDRSRA